MCFITVEELLLCVLSQALSRAMGFISARDAIIFVPIDDFSGISVSRNRRSTYCYSFYFSFQIRTWKHKRALSFVRAAMKIDPEKNQGKPEFNFLGKQAVLFSDEEAYIGLDVLEACSTHFFGGPRKENVVQEVTGTSLLAYLQELRVWRLRGSPSDATGQAVGNLMFLLVSQCIGYTHLLERMTEVWNSLEKINFFSLSRVVEVSLDSYYMISFFQRNEIQLSFTINSLLLFR